MNAGEIGVQITVEANVDITGASSTLIKVQGPEEETSRDLLATAVGTQALRSSQAADFPVGGNYRVQLAVVTGTGKTLKSPIKLLHIGDAI